MVTPQPPPPCAALIVRCREVGCSGPWWHRHVDKVYYWVPAEYKRDFLRLSLYAVSLRGSPQINDPNYHVTVKGIYPPMLNPGTKDVYRVSLVLDQKIPNDAGFIAIATVKNLLVNPRVFKILAAEGVVPQPAVPMKVPDMDVIQVEFSLSDIGQNITIDDVLKDLSKQTIGIRLNNYVPSISPTDNLLEGIRSQLELQRLDQISR
jgi:hypothetical protein